MKCHYIYISYHEAPQPYQMSAACSHTDLWGHTPAARVRRMKNRHDEQQEVPLRDKMWPIKIQEKVPCRTSPKDSKRNAQSQGADPGSRSSSYYYSSRRRRYARVLVLEDQEIEMSPYLPHLSSEPPYNFFFPGLVLIPSQITNATSPSPMCSAGFARLSLNN